MIKVVNVYFLRSLKKILIKIGSVKVKKWKDKLKEL
jgi:hypothetical protein